MSKGIISTIAGGLLVAIGVVAEIWSIGLLTPIAGYLISAGAGLLLTGIGTMIAGPGAVNGFSTSTRNPVAPQKICYGRERAGGAILYPFYGPGE